MENGKKTWICWCKEETERRRSIQERYNIEHNITPKTIKKAVKNSLNITKKITGTRKVIGPNGIMEQIKELKKMMKMASDMLDFESAIKLRDEINELKKELE